MKCFFSPFLSLFSVSRFSGKFSVCGMARHACITVLTALMAGTLPAASAVAAEEPEDMPEIVVTASRIEEPRSDVTQDVTVITRKEIEENGSAFVADVLRSETGLAIVQNGGPGKHASIFLRGGSPSQVVIMIDGVKVKSATTGSLNLAGILVDDIERIEIVRGAQSTLYGSEAMAGVVNIITRKGGGALKTAVSAEGGSDSTYRTTVSLSGGTDWLDYRLTGSYFSTDGISAAASGTEEDGYRNRAVSASVGIAPSERLSIRMNGRYYKDETDLDDYQWGVGMVDDLSYRQEGEHYLLSLRGSLFLLDGYEQVLTLSTVNDDLDSDDPDTSWNNWTVESNLKTADWQHNLYLGNATITGGIEYRTESGKYTSSTDSYDEKIDNRAAYLNGKIRMMDRTLVLNAGLRYDDHETAGSRTTYRVSASYLFTSAGLKLRSSYATGFRAPSLNELYYPNFGNTGLKPEKSRGYDIGLEQPLLGGRLTFSATYFKQKFDDLIQYDFATFTAQNIGNAEIEGIELGLAMTPANGIEIGFDYTNMDATDLDTDTPLSRRPENKFSSSLRFGIGPVMLAGEYLYVTKVYDSAVSRHLGSYSLVNIRSSYRISRQFDIFARVDNLLDEEYEEAGGYGTPGRSFFGGIRAEF